MPLLTLEEIKRMSPFFGSATGQWTARALMRWLNIVRLLRLPSELFNKRGGEARIMIGDIIPVSVQESIANEEEFGQYLRDRVYKTQ